MFVRPQDLDEHLRRLDANGTVHSQPVRKTDEGQDGTAIYWLDADGNQFEFWAPDAMPEGAMHDPGPLNIGRISHLTYASRDLERTSEFFRRYCGLEPARSAGIANGTLVLPLAAGGRLVFKLAAECGARASGRGVFSDCHTALVLRKEDFWPSHERMWAELPEWPFDAATRSFIGDGTALPARTLMHGSPNGMKFHAAFGRGDDWVDPDCNLFHFVGGLPQGARCRPTTASSSTTSWTIISRRTPATARARTSRKTFRETRFRAAARSPDESRPCRDATQWRRAERVAAR